MRLMICNHGVAWYKREVGKEGGERISVECRREMRRDLFLSLDQKEVI